MIEQLTLHFWSFSSLNLSQKCFPLCQHRLQNLGHTLSFSDHTQCHGFEYNVNSDNFQIFIYSPNFYISSRLLYPTAKSTPHVDVKEASQSQHIQNLSPQNLPLETFLLQTSPYGVFSINNSENDKSIFTVSTLMTLPWHVLPFFPYLKIYIYFYCAKVT